MNARKHWGLAWVTACVAAVGMAAVMIPLQGRAVTADEALGVPQDWSHHHLVFGEGTEPPQGTDSDEEIRARQQWYHRKPKTKTKTKTKDATANQGLSADARTLGAAVLAAKPSPPPPPSPNPGLWQLSMGSGASVGAGNFPAKYSFLAGDNASCGNAADPDFVVFTTRLAGAAGTANTQTLAVNNANNNKTVTINNAGINSATFTSDNDTGSVVDTPRGTLQVANIAVAGISVTVGAISYSFVNSSPTLPYQVQIPSGTPTTSRIATNLNAAINATSTCDGGGSGCYGTGTLANGAVTTTLASATITLTSTGATFPQLDSTNTTNVNANVSVVHDKGASTTGYATNLTNAINNFPWLGLTATSTGAVVTLTYQSVGASTNFGYTVAADNNITVGAVSTGTNNGQATLMAFRNINVGCPGVHPRVHWAYNTGGTAPTSPILSLDGKQVAFVQNSGGVSSGSASLVILKPLAGEGARPGGASEVSAASSPVAPTSSYTSASPAYYACLTGPTSCQLTLSISTGPVSNASPYYDYANDALYIGDDDGLVHKFVNVFNGSTSTPAAQVSSQTASSGWPTRVAPTTQTSRKLASSVGTNPVLVTDSGGYVSLIPAGGGGGTATAVGTGVARSSQLAGAATGFVDGPLFDPSAGTYGTFYTFANDDMTTDCKTSAGGAVPCAALWQFKLASTSSLPTPTKVVLGAGSTTGKLYIGNFDNTYYTNSLPTGNLYVCGRGGGTATDANAQRPQMWRVPLNENTLQPTTGAAVFTTGAGECSPVTEFYDGTNDRIFFGVTNNGGTNCTAGCVASYIINGGAFGTLTRAAMTGGTSGIVIDNKADNVTGKQLYFSPLSNMSCAGTTGAGTAGGTPRSLFLTGNGTGGCATQVTQSGLN